MVKSISARQEKRGRPATGITPSFSLRLAEDLTSRIDAWAAGQDDSPVRSEAIRRLLELGLTAKPTARPRAQDQKDRARELAGKVIDKMADAGASEEDKAVRKRRLIKGPSMVRDVRADHNSKK